MFTFVSLRRHCSLLSIWPPLFPSSHTEQLDEVNVDWDDGDEIIIIGNELFANERICVQTNLPAKHTVVRLVLVLILNHKQMLRLKWRHALLRMSFPLSLFSHSACLLPSHPRPVPYLAHVCGFVPLDSHSLWAPAKCSRSHCAVVH